MVYSTITSKGQTTIPVEVRNFLSIHAGDRIEYVLKANGEVTITPSNVSLAQLRRVLPPPKRTLSLEDIEKAIQAGWTRENK